MCGSSAAVEIDFFRLNDESSVISPPPRKFSDRRDIQGVVSKINPELLKTVIASASANNSSVPGPSRDSSPQQSQNLPVCNQDSGGVNLARCGAPLTIFYNGTVSVFDVSPNQAESIMKLAESESRSSKTVESTLLVKPVATVGGVLNKDLPLSRKKSLRRFLEKRKERQVAMSPYSCSQGNASSH